MPYPKGKPWRDLTGQRFGRLVVQGSTGKSFRGNIIWKCLCDCGVTREVPTSALNSGNTRSCGCLTKENQRSAVALPEGQAALNRVYRRYKKSAVAYERVFDLSLEQFRALTSDDCFYCGRKPEQIVHEPHFNGAYVHNGIDRVDTTKGYTMDNCVPCCMRCNRAKHTMTQDEFAELISQIYKHFAADFVREKEDGEWVK